MENPMAIAMTEQQERDFDENGFIILEDFLSPDEVGHLLAAVDKVAEKIRRTEPLAWSPRCGSGC